MLKTKSIFWLNSPRYYLCCFIWLVVYAQTCESAVVHGPFQTPLFENGQIYFEQNRDGEIQFILNTQDSSQKNKTVADRYERDGGLPSIESVFFYPVQQKKHIFVIVSWPRTHRGLGTYGTYYQVYAYYKDANGHLVQNTYISEDSALSGIDGHSDGQESIFKYKTAGAVKQYLRKQNNKLKR